ncbi:MAG: DUF3536 domain-containing protein [Dehalococcoidia bacterium]|nr:DUF3536 domain-containing protein [Dehalococcoidia bacterium]
MARYVCIHGHFYQPPRENAWLEAVEMQPSAYPYHDWNERIDDECYWPNYASQILDGEGRVERIVNNYSRISFDFGPTLLSWLETSAPETYQGILAADKESQKLFSGHGGAIACGYNHIILPLANQRDKRTQLLWGIRDFEHRFGREPEGMWLPETAVDIESLDIMAELGIRFTILAPRQAARVRRVRERTWQNVSGSRIDSTVPYRIVLPSGRRLAVFFYNGPVAHAVAFQGLLQNGENFARRLLAGVPEDSKQAQLAHIATDGESYGHHHRFGDMALAYALHFIEKQKLAHLTNYGEFLERHPPTSEVEVIPNTSWSCAHGVERWRSDCGCADHQHSGWDQKWRLPLRQALDWLRDKIAPEFEKKAGVYFNEPWEARDGYVSVILDRSPQSLQQFIDKHARRKLKTEETIQILKLMELQRHAMLMYTSCGWFYDDLACIETVQAMQYAGRVAQLSQELFGDATETTFLELLARAKSNRLEHGDGRQIYSRMVKPDFIDLQKVAAHYAVSSFFETHADMIRFYCYQVGTSDFQQMKCGDNRVNRGRIRVTSVITTEGQDLDFIALRRHGSTITVGIREITEQSEREKLAEEISNACSRDDSNWLERILDSRFSGAIFTIDSLFKDTQYRVLESTLDATLSEIKHLFYPGLLSYASVVPAVDEAPSPLPQPLQPLAALLLNLDLRREVTSENMDSAALHRALQDIRLLGADPDTERLGYLLSRNLAKKMDAVLTRPEDTALIHQLTEMVKLARSTYLPLNLHRVQYRYYGLLKTFHPDFKRKAISGDAVASDWVSKFTALGEALRVQVD